MTTRFRNQPGEHDTQQHVRYVQVYSISAGLTEITGATNDEPIEVTSASHGFTTGDRVKISGVNGNDAANGEWIVTVTSTNTFTLDDSTGDGAYTDGGEVGYAQPVRVKLLFWDQTASDYEVYGADFAIGDSETSHHVEEGCKLWITWRRDSLRWEPISPQFHYQIIRGVTTAAVSPAAAAFQVGSITAYEEFAATPTSPLWVKAPSGGVTLSIGDAIWAIYRENVLTFDPGPGVVQVDWLMFEPGSSNTPPLRRFELTANKALTSSTATVKFLDDAGALVGSNVTIYDPEQQFSGRIADELHEGSPAFRGIALLRTDLGAEQPDRWEIVGMEGLAELIVVKFYTGLTEWKFVTNHSVNDDWQRVKPAADDAFVTIIDPGGILPASVAALATDQKLIARRTGPDTDPPTYMAVSLEPFPRAKRVRGTVSATGSGFVAKADASFFLTSLTEVYGGPVPASPLTVHQISGFAQGFVAGQVTEAIYNETADRWECLPLPRKSLASIFEDNNGFNYVVADQLAGAGLAVEVGTGPAKTDGTGNTDKLKVVSVAAPPTEEGGGVVAVNSVESVGVSIDSGGQLSVQINYTTKYVYGSGGSGGNVSDNADIWNKATPTIVSDVECVEGSIQVTSSGATEYLTPP
jgi:hypothetical protein